MILRYAQNDKAIGDRGSEPAMKIYVPGLYFVPVDNLPQSTQMRSALVLVVEVVGMLPDVEGEEGLEAVGDGVVGVGVLGDGELTRGIGLEPDPAGAKEGGAFCFELSFEGVEGAPLLDHLSKKRRFFAALRMTGIRSELSKVEIVVQNLAGIVEHSTRFRVKPGMTDYLLQGHGFKISPGNQLVKVIHITLQVLAVMERQGLVADNRSKRFVW